jgi:hypothetical protein
MDVDSQAAYALQRLLEYAQPALLLPLIDMTRDVFAALDGYDPTHMTQYILILKGYGCSDWPLRRSCS